MAYFDMGQKDLVVEAETQIVVENEGRYKSTDKHFPRLKSKRSVFIHGEIVLCEPEQDGTFVTSLTRSPRRKMSTKYPQVSLIIVGMAHVVCRLCEQCVLAGENVLSQLCDLGLQNVVYDPEARLVEIRFLLIGSKHKLPNIF